MDTEVVMKLFDFYWFGQEVIKASPFLSSQTLQTPKTCDGLPTQELSRCRSWEVSSVSGELSSQTSFSSESSTPRSILPQYKLHTILTGKEVNEEIPKKVAVTEKHKVDKKRKHRSASSKSLSDLEFEELKGFMDLGFVFSEEDKNTRLASVIPGLQRLGKEDHQDEKKTVFRRPYLSEAWEVMNQREEQIKPLTINWRFPSLSNETDMKHHLRYWAHSVATTIK